MRNGCLSGILGLFLGLLLASLVWLIYFVGFLDPAGIAGINQAQMVKAYSNKPSQYEVITPTSPRTIPTDNPFIVVVVKPSSSSVISFSDGTAVFTKEDKKAASDANATWLVRYIDNNQAITYDLHGQDFLIVSDTSDALSYWLAHQSSTITIALLDPEKLARVVSTKATIVSITHSDQ